MLRISSLFTGTLLCLLFPFVSSAQHAAFNIGYGAGMFSHAPHNLEVAALLENEIVHPYWDNKINVNRFVHGPVLGWSGTFNQTTMFVIWSSRHNVYSGGGKNPTTGYDEKFSYKLKVSYISFGAMYGDKMRIGASFDYGRFKPFWKYDIDANKKTDGYELMYGKSRGVFSEYMTMGSSIIIEAFSDTYLVPRIVWHADWFGNTIDYGYNSFFYKSGTLSVELLARIGKK